jgi:hypothetical protein
MARWLLIPWLVMLGHAAAASPLTKAFENHALERGPDNPTSEATSEAGRENNAAMTRYRAKDMEGAKEGFVRALASDGTHALAHYNLACVLSLSLPDPMTTEVAQCDGPGPKAALYHLGRAVELDAKRRDRMREDSDLDKLRHFLAYDVIDGADLTDAAVLRERLVDTKFWGTKPGAYPASRLLLLADGVAKSESLQGDFQQVKETGTWKVLDTGVLELSFGKGTSTLLVTPLGVLTDEKGRTRYLSDPDACSA